MLLTDLVERLAIVLRAELRQVAAANGLQPAQLEVLRYLTACNRYSDTPTAVAEYLGATAGTVSQTLAALERKGLLEKVSDPSDGRRVHCRPTATATALVDRLSASEFPLAEPATEVLRDLLLRLQRSRGGRTFGECRTCRHHLRESTGARCGLTREPLTEEDAGRICREHHPV